MPLNAVTALTRLTIAHLRGHHPTTELTHTPPPPTTERRPMFFRRTSRSPIHAPAQPPQATTTPPATKPRATTPASVGEDMGLIENLLLRARNLRPLPTDHYLEELYQRLGAATAVAKPGEQLHIPLYETDLWRIQYACEEIQRHGPETHELLEQAQLLLRRLHFNLGHATAVRELGGLPVYASTVPALSHDA